MDELKWTNFSMGIVCVLVGIMAYVFGLLSITGLIILLIFGVSLTVLSGMPIWKAIYRRIRRKNVR